MGDAFDDTTIAAVPVRPISIDEFRLLTSRRQSDESERTAAQVAADGEDVVVDEAIALPGASDREPRGELRGTVRRAHEEMRLRNRERRPGVSPESSHGEFSAPEGDHPAANSSPAAHDFDHSVPTARMGEVPPVSRGELGRPLPRITTYAADADVFGTIPIPDADFDLPLMSKPKPARIVGRAGFDDHDGADGLAPWDSGSGRKMTRTEDRESVDQATSFRADGLSAESTYGPATNLAPSGATRARAEADRPRFEERTQDEPGGRPVRPPMRIDRATPQPRAAAYQVDDQIEITPRPRFELGDYEERSRTERTNGPVIDRRLSAAAVDEILQNGRVDSPALDRYVAAETLSSPIEGSAIRAETHRSSREIDTELDDELAEEAPANWSTVPRMCRSCRDFRPAENGERGWCTNKWAFSHRRMVDADELPCETSIGGWWLPKDDLWLSAADVSSHGQPTPLLDQWLAAKAPARGEYDVAPPLRRRQRS